MPRMSAELFLAIETSGRVGSVALARGEDPPDVRQLSADRRHTAELLPTIRDPHRAWHSMRNKCRRAVPLLQRQQSH